MEDETHTCAAEGMGRRIMVLSNPNLLRGIMMACVNPKISEYRTAQRLCVAYGTICTGI